MFNNVGSIKSTITGIVALVLGVLLALGVITPDESSEASGLAGGVLDGVLATISGLAGLYQIFFQNDDNG